MSWTETPGSCWQTPHVYSSSLVNMGRFGYMRFDGLSRVESPLTAASIGEGTMMIGEQGKIRLDDSVAKSFLVGLA